MHQLPDCPVARVVLELAKCPQHAGHILRAGLWQGRLQVLDAAPEQCPVGLGTKLGQPSQQIDNGLWG